MGSRGKTKPMNEMIPVTKPFLPPKEEYEKLLEGIWEREFLTNNGPLVRELEQKLKSYLDVDELLFLANGTLALQIAIKALKLKGDVITTPFSYVATTSSIVWESCNPVFVDIDPHTLNIDPHLIEQAITEETTAILATHVFGNPCNIEAIQAIADRFGLKVIYDAAHCFGTLYKGESVFKFGDISTSSFHATKLFHTVEGGAVFTSDIELLDVLKHMRNFGHDGPEKFKGVGINAKNSEFHAAMGLTNLNHIDSVLAKRKEQCQIYDSLLESTVERPTIELQASWNYAYYPIILPSEDATLKVKQALESENIFPRRYFYPSLETLHYVKSQETPNSNSISKRVLCLPLYHTLEQVSQERISKLIIHSLNSDKPS